MRTVTEHETFVNIILKLLQNVEKLCKYECAAEIQFSFCVPRLVGFTKKLCIKLHAIWLILCATYSNSMYNKLVFQT